MTKDFETKPTNGDLGKENTTEKQSQEFELIRKVPAHKSSDNKPAQETPTAQREEDASITSATEELEWRPVRHRTTVRKIYFVNKNGIVCAKADHPKSTRKDKQLKPVKGDTVRYMLTTKKGERRSFKLEEIMAYTFSDHFDGDKHYIVHKDGRRGNCAWNNLILCNDFPTLQQEEIAALERLYPDTKYTVVRNMHDTLTFECYLVSDAGKIYSLFRREHLSLSENRQGYLTATLSADSRSGMTAKAIGKMVKFTVQSIVMQSFAGHRVENLQIYHTNDNRGDNCLENLTHGPARQEKGRPWKPRTTTHNIPPSSEKTVWKTVGVLPWNGLSFSNYEVSDMGHVRTKEGLELLDYPCGKGGYPTVCIFDDTKFGKETSGGYQVIIARLVANAFVDGYSEQKKFIKRLNGENWDHRAQNLQWVSRIQCSPTLKPAYRVVASLVDDPKDRKEFPSISQAKRELSAPNLYRLFIKHGDSFTEVVKWDGEEKKVLVQVSRSKINEEE